MNYKVKGLLSYLLGWIPCVIILFCINDNTKDEYFNVAQALVLHVLYAISYVLLLPLTIIMSIANPFAGLSLSGCVSILYFILVIMGCINSYNEENKKLPVIGDLTEKIFKTKLDSFGTNSTVNNTGYNYDPNTGEKINNNQNYNYDPNTGEKINK